MYSRGLKSSYDLSLDRQVRRNTRSAGPLGAIAFYGMAGVILVSSIPYGSAGSWHRSLLAVLIFVIAAIRLIDGFRQGAFQLTKVRLLAPLAGIVGLAGLQLLQMPGGFSAVSVDPFETKLFILNFGAIVVALEVLLHYTNSRFRMWSLIFTVILIGLMSAVFGILRDAYLDPNSILDGYLHAGQGYAQFINRNHFAFLIEMSFGLVLGLLIKAGLSEKLKFAGWLIAGIMAYAAIAANSRGGLISMGSLALFAVLIHMVTRGQRPVSVSEVRDRQDWSIGRVLQKAALTVGLLVLVSGFSVLAIAFVGGDAVVSRVEKLPGELQAVENAGVNRNLIWASTIDVIRSGPIFGIGFGAYSFAITEFDRSAGKYSLEQAHNDYLEILSNGGIAGAGLFALFLLLLIPMVWTNLKSADRFRQASAFGAAIGMFGVFIHSFVDFGLHIPTNGLVLSVLIVIATATISRSATDSARDLAHSSHTRRFT